MGGILDGREGGHAAQSRANPTQAFPNMYGPRFQDAAPTTLTPRHDSLDTLSILITQSSDFVGSKSALVSDRRIRFSERRRTHRKRTQNRIRIGRTFCIDPEESERSPIFPIHLFGQGRVRARHRCRTLP
jgi:hypothetical protein